MNRFARTELLFGPEAMERLRRARVIVAGLGAVGSYAVEALARAGVGTLRVVDFDTVRESNLNRQLYALTSTLGRPKVEVCAERIHDINPDCRVEARQTFIGVDTARSVMEGGAEAAIDAIDSLNPKVALIRAAVEAGLPIVSCMGAARRTDPAAVRVGDLSETERCPLARMVRKRLRRAGIAEGVRCVFSVEPCDADTTAPPCSDPADATEPWAGRRRRPMGSVSYLTGIVGLRAAAEVIRMIACLDGKARGCRDVTGGAERALRSP